MFSYFKTAFIHIFRKKMRSLLTISGICIGILSIMIIATIGNFGKTTLNSELDSMGMGGLMVSAQNPLSQGMKDSDLTTIKKIDEVALATPILFNATQLEIINKNSNCIVFGVDEKVTSVVNIKNLYGRFINRFDVASSSNVCVVDEAFAKSSYKRGNIVGKKVSVLYSGSYVNFDIIGVVETGSSIMQAFMGEYLPNFIYIPHTTARSLLSKDSFDNIAIKLKPNTDGELASKKIKSTTEQFSTEKNIVKVENLAKQKDNLNNIMSIVTIILTAIAGISLLVSGLSIMTVMLVCVSERTREIGIKKSIGASKSIILKEFLAEAFLISLIGGVAGVFLGNICVFVGCLFLNIPFFFDAWLNLFCVVFGVVLGVIFGVYPAIKASKLSPMEALRRN
jgi:putative ABC transport system permease protein